MLRLGFVARALLLVLAVFVVGHLVALGCDRHVGPFDPNERVVRPDLSKIFPAGEKQAASQKPGLPAPAPAPGPQSEPGGEAPPIAGTIRVAREVAAQVPKGAVLFLIARNGQGGPPVAVERIADPVFPMRFSIGPEDRMIQGIPFAGPLHLIARLDSDGNAMTHSPADLQGVTPQPVQPGAAGVEIVIDQHVQTGASAAAQGGGAPPFAAGGAAADGQPAAAGPPIAGTIRLSPELAGHVPQGAVLFLIAHHPGGVGGPPVAVERIADPHFPMRFVIGPENRMIQAIPFTGPLTLIARIDSDGNAMTHSPGDLEGRTPQPVDPGAKGVAIVIDRKL